MIYAYRDGDGIVYRETTPLTISEQRQRGLKAHDGPEGTYVLLALWQGVWKTLGPMDGTFTEAVEVMEVNSATDPPRYSDFKVEKRLIGV